MFLVARGGPAPAATMSAGPQRLRRHCFRRAVSHSDLHQHFVTPGRIADDRVDMEHPLFLGVRVRLGKPAPQGAVLVRRDRERLAAANVQAHSFLSALAVGHSAFGRGIVQALRHDEVPAAGVAILACHPQPFGISVQV
jgi:hypothetical protein